MNKFFLLVLFCTVSLSAQIDDNALFKLEGATQTTISGLTPSGEGNFIYNTTDKKVYVFDGTSWRKLLFAPQVFEKTGNYTLVASDDGNVITFNSATNVTLTVPAGLAVGFNVSVYQIGVGRVTITEAGGVSVRNRLSRFITAGQNAGVGLMCTATNVFYATGDLRRN